VAPDVASVAALSAAELAEVLVAVELEPQAARPRAAAETPATFKKFLLVILCMIISPLLIQILQMHEGSAASSGGAATDQQSSICREPKLKQTQKNRRLSLLLQNIRKNTPGARHIRRCTQEMPIAAKA
jgi:hypothetical protein